jgi:hypothetical protein
MNIAILGPSLEAIKSYHHFSKLGHHCLLIGLTSIEQIDEDLKRYFGAYQDLNPLRDLSTCSKGLSSDAWIFCQTVRIQPSMVKETSLRLIYTPIPQDDQRNGEDQEPEEYLDCDAIIDGRTFYYNPQHSLGDNWALNEKKISQGLHYGLECFTLSNQDLENSSLTLIGDGIASALFLLRNQELVFSKKLDLTWITSETKPFHSLLSETSGLNGKLRADLEAFIHKVGELYREDCEAFELWRKTNRSQPNPIEPSPVIKKFDYSHVLSFDRLSDRQGIFITIERLSKESGQVQLHSRSSDRVLILTGFKRDHLLVPHGLPFYTLGLDYDTNLPNNYNPQIELENIEQSLNHL